MEVAELAKRLLKKDAVKKEGEVDESMFVQIDSSPKEEKKVEDMPKEERPVKDEL
jgi:hypothetical protein